ncbi:hypothetical protein [Spirosoma aerophilum]
MPTLLATGDQVIVISKEYQLAKLDIVDVDLRRDNEEILSATYWLSDGKAYQRTDLFTDLKEAKQHYQQHFYSLMTNFD